MLNKLLALSAAALALASCASVSDPTTLVSTVQSTYVVAVSGEIIYAKSGHADRVLLDKIEAARIKAMDVIGPIQTGIKAGVVPSNDLVLAAEAAVTALQALVPAQGAQ